mmetsp:Transcript_1027/g.1248  ORF Transcript_1027/g.1248 Transcript_1027/m.1248 type:complete len:95 (+) Transcript_1027:210-494(+)
MAYNQNKNYNQPQAIPVQQEQIYVAEAIPAGPGPQPVYRPGTYQQPPQQIYITRAPEDDFYRERYYRQQRKREQEQDLLCCAALTTLCLCCTLN